MLARMHCACAYFAPIAERIVRMDAPQAHRSTSVSLLHHSFKAVPTFLFYLRGVKRELKRMATSRVPKTIEATAP
jgi:hypothetical protein